MSPRPPRPLPPATLTLGCRSRGLALPAPPSPPRGKPLGVLRGGHEKHAVDLAVPALARAITHGPVALRGLSIPSSLRRAAVFSVILKAVRPACILILGQWNPDPTPPRRAVTQYAHHPSAPVRLLGTACDSARRPEQKNGSLGCVQL